MRLTFFFSPMSTFQLCCWATRTEYLLPVSCWSLFSFWSLSVVQRSWLYKEGLMQVPLFLFPFMPSPPRLWQNTASSRCDSCDSNGGHHLQGCCLQRVLRDGMVNHLWEASNKGGEEVSFPEEKQTNKQTHKHFWLFWGKNHASEGVWSYAFFKIFALNCN